MKTMDTLNNIEIPNISEILKSGKKVKGQMDNMELNKVNVHFLYSDGRFKRTVEGTIMHISEIPIVFIEYPAKLGFLVLHDTLIFDVTNKCFELIVNENYTHTVNINDLKTVDMNEKVKDMIEKTNFIIPISPTQFKFKEVNVNIPNGETETCIKLLPTFLSSLGRAKLLENTTEKSNDGLIIIGIMGFLVGAIVGIVGSAIIFV